MTYTTQESITSSTSAATMHLYGAIGEKVDGDLFARELASLDGAVDLVKIRVNSPGGGVFEGMSIVSAIMSMATPVHVYVDGIAASMAAVIAIASDRVVMYDYSKLMIHDPVFSGVENLSDKQKKMLRKIKDMLTTILSRRGRAEADISGLMAAETWFSAAEAEAAGLCDEILTSAKNELLNLSPDKIFTAISNSYTPIKNKTMTLTNQATTMLSVADATDEAAVSAAIVALHARAEAAEKKLADIEAATLAANKAEAATLIAAAQKDGRINADGATAYQLLFDQNHDAAKAALASIPARSTVTSAIKAEGARAEKLSNMSWEELDKGNHLAELKSNQPELYAEKFEDKYGRKPKS